MCSILLGRENLRLCAIATKLGHKCGLNQPIAADANHHNLLLYTLDYIHI